MNSLRDWVFKVRSFTFEDVNSVLLSQGLNGLFALIHGLSILSEQLHGNLGLLLRGAGNFPLNDSEVYFVVL